MSTSALVRHKLSSSSYLIVSGSIILLSFMPLNPVINVDGFQWCKVLVGMPNYAYLVFLLSIA